jgi:hypothetical protein
LDLRLKASNVCRLPLYNVSSGEAFGKHPNELSGVLPSKGGESVEEKIKLAIAVLQLLPAIVEIIHILYTHF